jgi:serine protease
MKSKTKKFFSAIVATLLTGLSPLAYGGGASSDVFSLISSPDESSTNQIIIKYRDNASAHSVGKPKFARAQDIAQQSGKQLTHHRKMGIGPDVFKIDQEMKLSAVRELANKIVASDPDVEYAEPDTRMFPALTPNDPQYGLQWHYYEPTGGINLPLAWDKSNGSGVVVAVLDTGYRPHADLVANVLPGYDFVTSLTSANDGTARDADATDPGNWCGAGTSSWHGTHVAGTIAAMTNNGVGVSGVAFGAKILPVRVLGKCGGSTSDIADAMVWSAGGSVVGVPANTRPAKVISLSLGSNAPTPCGTTYQNAINTARGLGSTFVIAAGNFNADASGYAPGNCTGIITVAATTRAGGKASFSNFGTIVDIAAPGDSILSTLNSGATIPGADSYAYYSGTSMATPHVSGVAALMLSVNPLLTPDKIELYIKSTARMFPATCAGCGAGIVNASAAVDRAKLDVGGLGTFALAGGSATCYGSIGCTASAIIQNVGTGIIGNISWSCSGGGSYHQYGNTPTTLLPGQSATFTCQAAASGTYQKANIKLTGTGVTNSGFTETTW